MVPPHPIDDDPAGRVTDGARYDQAALASDPELVALTARLRTTIPGARLAQSPLPLAPELPLVVLSVDYPRAPMSPEQMHRILANPAYWAFCWASGQALARHLIDHPGLVRGRSVLDFGCGAGVAALAAVKAGAAAVTACDLDSDARRSCALNARLHNAEIRVLGELAVAAPGEHFDTVLLADVLYDANNLRLLDALVHLTDHLLIADSRVKHIPIEGLRAIAEYETSTHPDLDESPEFRHVVIHEWRRR